MNTAQLMAAMIGDALKEDCVTQRHFATVVGIGPERLNAIIKGRQTTLAVRLDNWAAALGRRWSVALVRTTTSETYWAAQPPARVYEALRYGESDGRRRVHACRCLVRHLALVGCWLHGVGPVDPSAGCPSVAGRSSSEAALMACFRELAQVEDVLAEGLGYERSDGGPDDPNGGGYLTGDHTALTLAMEARTRLLDDDAVKEGNDA